MKAESLAICTWSLANDLDQVMRVMKQSNLRCLHLDVNAADDFADTIKAQNWRISSTMVAFPQEDYTTMERIRATGGIMPDACWPVNRKIALESIRKTAQLGVGYLSTHAGFIDHGDKEGYRKFRSRILELADAAAEAGIMLLMETGQETAGDLEQCLKDLAHPALGVNFDPANMILYDKGNPIEAIKVLAPWIRHVHVKDAIRTSIAGEWGTEVAWGQGQVPHGLFLQTLREIDYSGYLAIEREAGDQRADDIKLAVRRLRENL